MDKRGAFIVPLCAGFALVGCAASGGADVGDPGGGPPTSADAGAETGVDARGAMPEAGTDARGPTADSGSTATDASPTTDGATTTTNPWCAGSPITGAAPGTWSWLPVPEAKCGKGAGLGIALNPSATSNKLIVFLNGGGGCWDGPSCAGGMSTPVANMDGDYSITKLENDMSAFQSGSVFDRSSSANPFRDWNYVFVPYCTGDFHSGDVHTSYDVDHVGYANVTAYLHHIVPTWCAPDQVVLTGVSAGGYGSVFDFEQVKEAFGAKVHVDLVDDSGAFWRPGFGDAKVAKLHAAWGTAATASSACSGCSSDWSQLFPYLSAKYPDSRFSLVTAIYDDTICPYFGITTPDACAAAYDDLADGMLASLPNFRVFYIASPMHVWLGHDLSSTVTAGQTLASFLEQQVNGDPSWSSARP